MLDAAQGLRECLLVNKDLCYNVTSESLARVEVSVEGDRKSTHDQCKWSEFSQSSASAHRAYKVVHVRPVGFVRLGGIFILNPRCLLLSMPPYEWPAANDLHGVQSPPPISDPPTLRDLSNTYGLKHHLFLATSGVFFRSPYCKPYSQLVADYPNEALGNLVLLEHNLCHSLCDEQAAPAEPAGIDLALGNIQATLNQIQATQTEMQETQNTMQQTQNTMQQTLNQSQQDQGEIKQSVKSLTNETCRNYAAMAKVLNSMQPIGPHIPLLTVPLPDLKLPLNNASLILMTGQLDVLCDQFMIHHLPAHQRKRYYSLYYSGGQIEVENEQTAAILQAVGCKLVEGA
ncbi:hypothetical protein BDN71DRAFT_1435970 [Pleurotus eryngii]|uniref:Mug135-like C-terminal domain-containing protein n=1 Tax=Pleurotus eryngii TaxID=5323 RepID=A0A9P5ZJK5_PLEER|nr:hypothetical protein BDN71DRAFT_1435970 [Pleurotus eryngii]